MEPGQGRRLGWLFVLAPLFSGLAGCALGSRHLDQTLLAHKLPAAGPERFASSYLVRFPDILDIQVKGAPNLSGSRPLAVDGRVEVRPGIRLRVENQTTSEIASLLANQFGLPRGRIHVRVEAYNSQRVLLEGEVKGETRAVPYVGPETVLEMLQRVGGITAGAAPTDIQVVRAHVAEGKQPEVFKVDLEAILEKDDLETNVKLRPFDQVCVGQSRRSSIKKCLPPWLRPFFGRICGLARPGEDQDPRPRLLPALAERPSPRYMTRREQ
jgi:protein involved in polysaccharide export with SLBB domain